MIKKIVSLILLLSVFTGVFLTACNRNPPQIEKIEIGFNNGRGATGKYNSFFCGAKSDTVIFDVDDVKIDFYFGWANIMSTNINGTSNSTPSWSLPDDYERVAIAAYFYGYTDSITPHVWTLTSNEYFLDYSNIENFYFIKEFSAEEFFAEEYAAIYTSSGLFGSKTDTVFNYYETITVPREILNKETGSFYFGIFDVLYSMEEGLYIFNQRRTLHDDVQLRYEYLNDSQITIKGYTQK